MRVQEDADFLTRLKTLNIRIRKRYKEQIAIFIKNPNDSRLHNHELHDEYEKLYSIDITNDYRAVYEKVVSRDGEIAYFMFIGTHEELYEKKIFTVILKN